MSIKILATTLSLREWLTYLSLAALVISGITLPFLWHPSSYKENNDLRERVYLLEKNLAELQEKFLLLKRSLEDRHLHTLRTLLELSPEQESQIKKILTASRQISPLSSGDKIWQELELREKIFPILSETQRKQYLAKVEEEELGF
jgi:hypothetical protein